MHYGKAYRGVSAPAFRHGWYSKDILCQLMWEIARQDDLLTLPSMDDLVHEDAGDEVPMHRARPREYTHREEGQA